MPYIFGAFIFGLFIPYMARRFAKFMPATFALAVLELFRREKKLKSFRKTKEYKKFILRSIISGITAAGVMFIALSYHGNANFEYFAIYLLILLLLAEIDYRSYFLPDILTVPLILAGFFAAVQNYGIISAEESALGALIGYFFPVAISFLIVWKNKSAFGGGDIKLLSAVGAWLGVENLFYVIVISSVLGILYGLIERKRSLAYGPMIAIAGIFVAIMSF